MKCPNGQNVYTVKSGDTCWEIARRFDMSVPQLEGMNEGIECDRLSVGRGICVLGKEGRE